MAPLLDAQELPIRTWGVRDGLAQSRVNSIRRDSNGYLWFATWEGASRFDGRRFVNYGSREGLPNPLVWCTAESPDGDIWLGTHGGGLAHVASTGCALLVEPRGVANPAERVFEIAFDRDGRMWIDTERGLFRAERATAGRQTFEHVDELGADFSGRALLDEHSELWFIAAQEVVHCRGRKIERWALPFSSQEDLRSIAPRRAGGYWAAYTRSLHVIELPTAESSPPRRTIQQIDFGANASLYDVCENDAGRLWVATSRGLLCLDGGESHLYTTAHGLPDDWVHSLAQDPGGGLWIGTHQGGAAFLSDSGVEHFSARNGLGDGHAVKLLALGPERWLVATEVAGIFELDHGRAHIVPGSDAPPFERVQRNFARDGSGEWWIATDAGTFTAGNAEFDLTRAVRVDAALGLPIAATRMLGIDSVGDVLLGTNDGRVFAGGNAGRPFRLLAHCPSQTLIHAFAIGANQVGWISDGVGLWRTRDDRPTAIDPWPMANGASLPRVMLIDSRGWLWIGTRFGGLAFSREPQAETPLFERLTSKDGLASDTVWALLEDPQGALYIGTGRGVQRYQPVERRLEPIGAEEGLDGEWVRDLALDARGELWVAAVNGISHLPAGVRHRWLTPARVRFTRCSVAGADLALAAEGSFEPPSLRVDAGDSRLSFEFVAVDPVGGAGLSYQTRLKWLDADWGQPSRELGVRYGQLASGSYEFEVRSVDPSSGAAGEVSRCRIEVVPPFWKRPWFVAMASMLALAVVYWAHRVRLERELALERLRTQISSDMHDDFGGGLAQIAISSELARRSEPGAAGELMGEVAVLARDLRASMSDLVWAVDPRHDSLSDVVMRMRHCAGDLIACSGQVLEFSAPDEPSLSRLSVSPDWRRNIYLIFKESITNVARHAQATRVRVDIELLPGRVRISIQDDGAGFDARAPRAGNGLRNLRRRAGELGANLTLDSSAGRGTRTVLDAPL